MLNSDGNHEPSQEQHTGGLEVVDTNLNGDIITTSLFSFGIT